VDAPVALTDEKTGVFEHAHMLRDRRQGHLERFGKLADRPLTSGELRQHRPPRGIGKRGERRVERVIVNQVVKYYARDVALSTGHQQPATGNQRMWSNDCE
jgi:hypothetical protein